MVQVRDRADQLISLSGLREKIQDHSLKPSKRRKQMSSARHTDLMDADLEVRRPFLCFFEPCVFMITFERLGCLYCDADD